MDKIPFFFMIVLILYKMLKIFFIKYYFFIKITYRFSYFNFFILLLPNFSTFTLNYEKIIKIYYK